MSNDIEKRIAHRLIDDALTAGYCISVFDGESYPVKRSTDPITIKAAIASSDDDTLVFRRLDGTKVGFVWLIWGNGVDLIADCSLNSEIDEIMRGAQEVADNA